MTSYKSGSWIDVEVLAYTSVLPANIAELFSAKGTTHLLNYTATLLVPNDGYIGDEHLDALDVAYKGGKLVHWTINDHGNITRAHEYNA